MSTLFKHASIALLANFLCGKIADIFVHVGPVVSALISQLCLCGTKAATDGGWNWVVIKLTLKTKPNQTKQNKAHKLWTGFGPGP